MGVMRAHVVLMCRSQVEQWNIRSVDKAGGGAKRCVELKVWEAYGGLPRATWALVLRRIDVCVC